MEIIEPREGDRCPQCGTPMEPIPVDDAEGPQERHLVLRCANGHEHPVTRHDAPDPNAASGPE